MQDEIYMNFSEKKINITSSGDIKFEINLKGVSKQLFPSTKQLFHLPETCSNIEIFNKYIPDSEGLLLGGEYVKQNDKCTQITLPSAKLIDLLDDNKDMRDVIIKRYTDAQNYSQHEKRDSRYGFEYFLSFECEKGCKINRFRTWDVTFSDVLLYPSKTVKYIIQLPDGIKNQYFKIDYNKEKDFLCRWDEISGSASNIFLKFLKDDCDVNWSEGAKIEKSDDKNICISKNENTAQITLDEANEKAILNINNNEICNFKIKREGEKLNIYKSYIQYNSQSNLIEAELKNIKIDDTLNFEISYEIGDSILQLENQIVTLNTKISNLTHFVLFTTTKYGPILHELYMGKNFTTEELMKSTRSKSKTTLDEKLRDLLKFGYIKKEKLGNKLYYKLNEDIINVLEPPT